MARRDHAAGVTERTEDLGEWKCEIVVGEVGYMDVSTPNSKFWCVISQNNLSLFRTEKKMKQEMSR